MITMLGILKKIKTQTTINTIWKKNILRFLKSLLLKYGNENNKNLCTKKKQMLNN